MKQKFTVFKCWIKYYLDCFFAEHKKCFWWSFAIILAGMLAGIFYAVESLKTAVEAVDTVEIFSYNYIELMKIGKFSTMSLWLKYFATLFVCLALIFLPKLFPRLKFLNIIVLLWCGFNFGVICIKLFYDFVFSALICFIFTILASHLIVLCAIVICNCLVFDSVSCKKGCNVACMSGVRELLKAFMVIFLVTLIALILFCIIIPLIIKIVIVV